MCESWTFPLMNGFQLDEAFQFPDYDDPALLRILVAEVRKDGLKVELTTAKRAVAMNGATQRCALCRCFMYTSV
jgi:hypothetical protein